MPSKDYLFFPTFCTARTGSTFLMKLLSYFPEFIVTRSFPYEVRFCLSQLSLMQIEFQRFSNNEFNNPYFSKVNVEDYIGYVKKIDQRSNYYITRWVDEEYTKIIVDATKRKINGFYSAVSKGQGKQGVYFSEKTHPKYLELIQKVYPEFLGIVLIRHPLDNLASRIKKFGKFSSTLDETKKLIAIMQSEYKSLYDVSEKMHHKTYVCTYEKLITDPIVEVLNIAAHFKIEMSVKQAASIVTAAQSLDKEICEGHKTNSSYKLSINSFQNYFDHSKIQIFADLLHESAALFGYDILENTM